MTKANYIVMAHGTIYSFATQEEVVELICDMLADGTRKDDIHVFTRDDDVRNAA